MQKEDGNKNALRSNARNQGQQIQPSRNIENRGVQDEIYCEDTIENCGHFLSFRTTGLSSALNPSGHSSLITHHSSLITHHSSLCLPPSHLLELFRVSSTLHLDL